MKQLIILSLLVSLAACDSNNSSSSTGSGGSNQSPATEQPEGETTNPDAIQSEPIAGSGIRWKPVSESDGKLVVLIPSSFSSGTSVDVLSVNTGSILGAGRYVGRTNGDRPTYRFSRTGATYPSPCALKVGDMYFYIPQSRANYG